MLRKLGLIGGVSAMQLGTAAALALLSVTAGPAEASIAWTAYMALQFMSQPGMYSYLMTSASPSQRSTASALNFIVMFSAQAIAAAVAGPAIARFGYPPVIAAAAMLCALAAAAFRFLVPALEPPPRSGQ
jgi:predicted MFS family arabinose efflux permease